MSRVTKVAAASVAPVFLDRDATVEKACSIIAEAAGASRSSADAYPP